MTRPPANGLCKQTLKQPVKTIHFKPITRLPLLTAGTQLPARYGCPVPLNRPPPPPVITVNTTKQLQILLFSQPLRLELSQRSPWCTSVSLPARSCCRTRSSPHTCLQPTAGHSVPHTHRRRSQPPPTCSKKFSHVRQERRWKTRQSGTQAVAEMAKVASFTDQ